MMKTILSVLLFFSVVSAHGAEESKLVDVDKNSKLSDYFQKINPKVSSDSEEKALAGLKPSKAESHQPGEKDILLETEKKPKKESKSLSPVNKLMLSVLAILGLAALSLLAIQKMGKNKGHTEIAKNITVLTQKPIGPKKNLMLIRVAGETILLGVTDHNINHLKTLSLMDDELPSYTEPQFRNQLKEKIAQTKAPEVTEEVDGFSVSRLDDVKKAVSQRFSI